ncbi:MAG: HAMP domain-containing protein, partial [Elusimicrobiota bacterium]|jgi:HAMP domain-containing protein|nr:HAMP domain-containing protein [Elusimicrobiota bacterium]
VRRNANVLIEGLVSRQSAAMIQENDVITSWLKQDDRILNVVYFNGNGTVRWHKDINMWGRTLPEYDRGGHLETDAVFDVFQTKRHRVMLKGDGNVYEIAIPLLARDKNVAGVISLDVSREEVREKINEALLSYLAGAVAIFALMGFVLYLFVIRNVVNPLNYLTDSIENVSTKSFQFDFIEREDEVGALAKAVERFLNKVKKELEERETMDKDRQHYEQEWWASVLAITIPKGSRAIVVDENNNVMHSNFELAIKKDGPVHLLDIFGGTQQDIVHLVGQAMDNPGKIFRAKTESGGRAFAIKTLQLSSKGGVVRTVIVLEPLSSKE